MSEKQYKKVNKKPDKAGTLVVAIFITLFVLCATVAGIFIFSKPDLSGRREESDYVDYHTDEAGNKYVTSVNEQGENVMVEIDKVAKDNHYNFLVVGKDRAYFNTDVIMLVSFDTDTGAVSMMQIPRDTYIELQEDTRRVKKANSLLAHFYNASYTGNYKKDLVSGLEKLKSALSEVLGVPIDYYVMLDLNGFVNIVDAIGGVDMTVPNDMHYEDPEQGLYIHLKKGYQNLDGNEAEQFIRFRKGYVNADLGRVDAQKLFMRAFIEKVQKKFNVNTIVTVAEQLSKYVTTDLEISDILFFAKNALSVDTEKVIMSTVPGDLAGAYYVVSRSGTYEAINTYFNPYNVPIKQDKFDSYGGFYDEEGTKIYAVYMGDDSLLAYYNSEDIKIPQVATTVAQTTSEEPIETTVPVSGTVHTQTGEVDETTELVQTDVEDSTKEPIETTVCATEETSEPIEDEQVTDVVTEETSFVEDTKYVPSETDEIIAIVTTETAEPDEKTTAPEETVEE